MLLIATDEAGYGPKLGPLVVAATVWRVASEADEEALTSAYAPLLRPVLVDGTPVVIGDSKTVFKPSSTQRRRPSGETARSGYEGLQTVTLAGCRWCGWSDRELNLFTALAPTDVAAVGQQPWLAELLTTAVSVTAPSSLIEAWSAGPARLVAMAARVITAAEFNRRIGEGMNKSDLLSATTLSLVRSLIETHGGNAGEAIEVFCDRHGGRRYYAGPIQAAFGDTLVGVIGETNRQSGYRVPFSAGDFRIRFTVKGDSFAPVAFSSMVAKCLREKAMECFNGYFRRLAGSEFELRPTAGYPVDADRFLADVQPLVRQTEIDPERLVRRR
jgi:hypothetical protein